MTVVAMIVIEYTMGPYGSEPGPIIFCRGECCEYLRFLNDIHSLGGPDPCECFLEHLEYVSLVNISSFQLCSVPDGGILCKWEDSTVVMKLDAKHWRDVIHNVLSITFRPSFVYQEFDGKNLIEDAKIIMRADISSGEYQKRYDC